jgi:hypothetical protein
MIANHTHYPLRLQHTSPSIRVVLGRPVNEEGDAKKNYTAAILAHPLGPPTGGVPFFNLCY